MSKLITNTIRHTGGSADNITLDNSQNVTFEADAIVDGRINIGSTGGFDSNGDDLTITNASHGGITIKTGTSSDGIIRFGDGSGAAEYRGYINYKHADDDLVFGTGANERFRIDSSGRLLLGTTTEGQANADNFTIDGGDAETGITIRSGNTRGQHIYFSDGTSGDDEYRGIISYQHSDNRMQFHTDTTERMRIDSSGNVKIQDGDLVIGTAGHGIDFSANSHASGMSSEILDDYEEGTWVPNVEGYTSAGTTTYNSNRLGQYVKIGRQVTAWFYVGWTAQNGSGSLAITLPFTCSDTSAHQVAGSVFMDSIDTNGDAVNHVLHTWHSKAHTLIYYTVDNGGWSGVQIDSAGSVIGTITYLVA